MSRTPHEVPAYDTGRGLAVAAIVAAVVAILALLLLPLVTGTSSSSNDVAESSGIESPSASTHSRLGPVLRPTTSHPRLGTVVRRTTSHPRLGPVVRHTGDSAASITTVTP